jgi:hypothetical protein
MINGLHPDLMSPAERLAEIGRILAAGLRRIPPEVSTPLSANSGDSFVDFSPLKSGRVRRKPRDRVGG